jgi:hypothetical protein
MPTVQFLLRNGTRDEWTGANPILDKGEPGVEHDTGQMKVGDGVNSWNLLPYVSTGSAAGIVPRNSLITNTKWLAGGCDGGGGGIFISGDGASWNVPTDPPNISGRYVYSIINDGLRWIIGCDGGGGGTTGLDESGTPKVVSTHAIFESLDGESWTPMLTDPFDGGVCYGIAFNGNMYVAVGSNDATGVTLNTNTVYSSTDRIHWTPAAVDPFASVNSGVAFTVCWTGRIWVIGGANVSPADTSGVLSTSNIYSSPDGVNWTKVDSNFFNGGTVYSIAYNGGRYVFAGTNGGSLFYTNTNGTATIATCTDAQFLNSSLEGITNTNDPFGSGNANGVAWNGEYWLAVGTNTPPVGQEPSTIVNAAFSDDGLTWSVTSPFGNGIGYGVAWSGNDWVLSGTDVKASLFVPPAVTSVYGRDGINWKAGTNAVAPTAESVQYAVAVKNTLAGVPVPTVFAAGREGGELQLSDGNGNFVSDAGLYFSESKLVVPTLNAGDISDFTGSTGYANHTLTKNAENNLAWAPILCGITPPITGTEIVIGITGMGWHGVVVSTIVGVVAGPSCFVQSLVTEPDKCTITLSEHVNPHAKIYWFAPSMGDPINGSITITSATVDMVDPNLVGITFTNDLATHDIPPTYNLVMYETANINTSFKENIPEVDFSNGSYALGCSGAGLTEGTTYSCYITATAAYTTIASNTTQFKTADSFNVIQPFSGSITATDVTYLTGDNPAIFMHFTDTLVNNTETSPTYNLVISLASTPTVPLFSTDIESYVFNNGGCTFDFITNSMSINTSYVYYVTATVDSTTITSNTIAFNNIPDYIPAPTTVYNSETDTAVITADFTNVSISSGNRAYSIRVDAYNTYTTTNIYYTTFATFNTETNEVMATIAAGLGSGCFTGITIALTVTSDGDGQFVTSLPELTTISIGC